MSYMDAAGAAAVLVRALQEELAAQAVEIAALHAQILTLGRINSTGLANQELGEQRAVDGIAEWLLSAGEDDNPVGFDHLVCRDIANSIKRGDWKVKP